MSEGPDINDWSFTDRFARTFKTEEIRLDIHRERMVIELDRRAPGLRERLDLVLEHSIFRVLIEGAR